MTPNYLHQLRNWAGQHFVWSRGEFDRMARAATAKGLGLNPSEYNAPYPGTTTVQTINVMGVGDGSTAPAPTPTVAPPASPAVTPATPVATAASSLLTGRNAAVAGLAAALLSGGGLAGWLAGRPGTTPATVSAVVAPATSPQGWRVRVNWTDADGKPQQQVSPIEPIDPARSP